jgi:hypothetical protein
VSGASYKHYFESLSSGVLIDDAPVSTYQTLTTIDNVLHLVDSAPVYRINWVDNVGIAIPVATLAPGLQIAAISFNHLFPATIVKEWQYTNYDIRVATDVSTPALYIYAAIANPQASGSASDPNVLGALLATTTNSSPAWTLDGVISTSASNRNENVELINDSRTNTEIAIDHAGRPAFANVTHAQFQLSLLALFETVDDANSAHIYGIQVREYVNDG